MQRTADISSHRFIGLSCKPEKIAYERSSRDSVIKNGGREGEREKINFRKYIQY